MALPIPALTRDIFLTLPHILNAFCSSVSSNHLLHCSFKNLSPILRSMVYFLIMKFPYRVPQHIQKVKPISFLYREYNQNRRTPVERVLLTLWWWLQPSKPEPAKGYYCSWPSSSKTHDLGSSRRRVWLTGFYEQRIIKFIS
jgi:hypothetical protein